MWDGEFPSVVVVADCVDPSPKSQRYVHESPSVLVAFGSVLPSKKLTVR